MGKSKPVTLLDKTFQTKGAALSFFKALLNRYEIGALITEEDSEILLALLKKHSEYSLKAGVGVKRFEIDRSPDHKTRCFYVVRIDGTQVDFSYIHCIDCCTN